MSEANGATPPVPLQPNKSPRYAKNSPIIPSHSSSTISSQPLTKIFPVVQQPQAAHRRNPAKPQNPPHQQNRRVAHASRVVVSASRRNNLLYRAILPPSFLGADR